MGIDFDFDKYASEALPIIRLWTCDKLHMPISFMSREQEACPLCDAAGLRKKLEQEVEELSSELVQLRENASPHPPKFYARRSKRNPYRHRRSLDSSAVILGACAGFIAALFMREAK